MLNSAKTNYIRFHTNQYSKELDVDIRIANESIKREGCVKFLGVLLDDTLNWKNHCQSVISKLNSLCFLIRNLRSVLNLEQLLLLYHGQGGSRLTYGIGLWGSSAAARDVFLAQKRVIRCIAGVSSTTSCREYFKRYKVLPLASVLIFELCKYIFKHQHNIPKSQDFHDYDTRHKHDLRSPNVLLNCGRNAPHILGLKLFNHLPTDIKDRHTYRNFRCQLKSFLVENALYSVQEFLA